MSRAGGNARDSPAAALLEAIVAASDDAIVTSDVAGDITTWNQAAERFFGYTSGEILGRPYVALFPDHFQGEAGAILERVMGGDRVSHFETEILRKDGMPTLISLTLWPLYNDDEEAVGSILIARDITEQRLAQAALAEVEARVYESEALAHVGSWLWDVRTGAVQWSAEFHRIHGVDPLEFDGTFESYIGTIHPDDRDRIRAEMEFSVASNQPFEDEYRVVRGEGDVRSVHARAQPTVGSAGTVLGLRGIGQDITDLR